MHWEVMVDQYATHQRLLIAAVMQTDGQVVEMGCGDYSTPLLAEIAAAQGRQFVVYTTSDEWGSKYQDIADVRILRSWFDYPYPACGLTLLDNEEYVRDRKKHVPRLLDTSTVVVCHDMGTNEWGAKFSTADTIHKPPTVALSNHKKIVFTSRSGLTYDNQPIVTVACVYKTGGDFTAEYVHRLIENVREHITRPHRFVCLTDSNEKFACETLPLIDGLPGWWSKLELFRLFHGRTVYFDLDTIIVGNIDPLLDYDGPVALLQDWYSEEPKLSTPVMAWNSPVNFIYPTTEEKQEILQAPRKMDEFFVVAKLERAKWHVDDVCKILSIVSYKKHCRERGVPDNARIVCFHGHPRPHEIGWKL